MFAKPAVLNLLVIRSSDLERAKEFYEQFELFFAQEQHGSGPVHLSASASKGDPLFEIYPLKEGATPTTGTRLGFSVHCVDRITDVLKTSGHKIISRPKDSEWGRRAVVEDPDGHRVELVNATQPETSSE